MPSCTSSFSGVPPSRPGSSKKAVSSSSAFSLMSESRTPVWSLSFMEIKSGYSPETICGRMISPMVGLICMLTFTPG